jgi:threonine-phosphate decarboxylase
MSSKYIHGGGYRKAAIEAGLDIKEVTDYSISINWKAQDHYPEEFIYIHYDNMEYPDPNYPELTEIIEETYALPRYYFHLCHGANESIATLFYYFVLREYHKTKTLVLVGPTYSEYNKYSSLTAFETEKIHFDALPHYKEGLENKIFVIVNPNTPTGIYYNLVDTMKKLLSLGAIIVLDESFIDFTDRESCRTFIHDFKNLFIVQSLTKFYGSAGARLGLLINANNNVNSILRDLVPPWTISRYDSWFYQNMILKHRRIKSDSLKWITNENMKLRELMENRSSLILLPGSTTSYHTLEFTDEFIKKKAITDIRQYCLENYKIYIRPTQDFYGCSQYSFRVGLRKASENIPLFNAIKEIG